MTDPTTIGGWEAEARANRVEIERLREALQDMIRHAKAFWPAWSDSVQCDEAERALIKAAALSTAPKEDECCPRCGMQNCGHTIVPDTAPKGESHE